MHGDTFFETVALVGASTEFGIDIHGSACRTKMKKLVQQYR